jgi:hypothetical protein
MDTVLETRGHLLQNPTMAVDTLGTLHFAWEAYPTSAGEIRYLRAHLSQGWDAVSTRVISSELGSVSRPQLLPSSDVELHLAYLQYTPTGPGIRLRRRYLGPAELSDVAQTGPVALPGLRAGPNPVRIGRALRLWCDAPDLAERPVVEFFDVAGRQVGTAALAPGHGGWQAVVPAQVTGSWSSGVLFARVQRSRLATLRLVVIR